MTTLLPVDVHFLMAIYCEIDAVSDSRHLYRVLDKHGFPKARGVRRDTLAKLERAKFVGSSGIELVSEVYVRLTTDGMDWANLFVRDWKLDRSKPLLPQLQSANFGLSLLDPEVDLEEAVSPSDGAEIDEAPSIEIAKPEVSAADIESADWTGIEPPAILSVQKAAELRIIILDIERQIELSGITDNAAREQAIAIAIAVRALASAPEPPQKQIRELLMIASAIFGIGSFFLAALALVMQK